MGIGYAIGFSMSGLKFGITLGLLFGLLNVIPYLGSVVGVILTFLIAYLQPEGIAESGQWGLAWCTLTFIVVQLIESYYLTPKIMGRRNRPSSSCGDRINIFLGNCIRGNFGDDLWYSFNRFHHHCLAIDLSKIP